MLLNYSLVPDHEVVERNCRCAPDMTRITSSAPALTIRPLFRFQGAHWPLGTRHSAFTPEVPAPWAATWAAEGDL